MSQFKRKGQSIVQLQDRISKPPKYMVVFLNDNYTTFDFVQLLLMRIFHHNYNRAYDLTQQIHDRGSAIVEIGLNKEIAQTKVNKVVKLARDNDFPFLALVEAEID
jgi:ATP-dependent Clp protease adaptor protein ClpS